MTSITNLRECNTPQVETSKVLETSVLSVDISNRSQLKRKNYSTLTIILVTQNDKETTLTRMNLGLCEGIPILTLKLNSFKDV